MAEQQLSQSAYNLLYQKAREWKLGQTPEGTAILDKERKEFLGRDMHTGFTSILKGRNRQKELLSKYGEIQHLKEQGFNVDALEKGFYESQDTIDHIKTAIQGNQQSYGSNIVGRITNFNLPQAAIGFVGGGNVDANKDGESGTLADRFSAAWQVGTGVSSNPSKEGKAYKDFVKFKQGQQRTHDPIKAAGADILTDKATYLPLPFLKGATFTARALKNVVPGAAIAGGSYAAKHGGEEEFSYKDLGINTALGGAFGGILGGFLGPKVGSVADLPTPHEATAPTFIDQDITDADALIQSLDKPIPNTNLADDGVDLAFTRSPTEAADEIAGKTPVYSDATYEKANSFFGVHGWDSMTPKERNMYVEDMFTHPQSAPFRDTLDMNPVRHEAPEIIEGAVSPRSQEAPVNLNKDGESKMSIEDIATHSRDTDMLDFVHKAWNTIRDSVEPGKLFSYRSYRGVAGDIETISANVLRGVRITREGKSIPLQFRFTQTANRIIIQHSNPQRGGRGELSAYLDKSGNIRSIYAGDIGQGNNGAAMYHVLAEWANKNNKRINLNRGFTPDNQLQRPTHIFSSTLRSNTRSMVFRPASDVNLPHIQGSTGANRFAKSALAVLHSYTSKTRGAYDVFSFNPESGKFTYRGADINARQFRTLLDQELRRVGSTVDSSNRGHRQALVTKGLIDYLRKNPGLRGDDPTELLNGLGRRLKDNLDGEADNFHAIAYAHPSIVGGILGGAGSTGSDLDGDGQSGTIKDILYGAIGGAILGTAAKHLWDANVLRKEVIGSRTTKEADAIYSAARQETIDKLNDLKDQLTDRLATAVNGTSRRNIRQHIERVDTHLSNISRLKGFDEMLAATRNSGFREYLQDKAQPVVQVSEANLDAIAKALDEGDLHGATNLVDFNVNRIDSTEEVEALIAKTSEVARLIIERSRRGTQTFEDITRNAEDFGMDITKLNQLYGDTNMLAEKVLAGKMLFIRITEDAITLGKKARDGIATDADRIEFKRLLAVQAGVQAQYKASQTEVARALAAMRITTRGRRGSPQDELQQILGNLDSSGKLDEAMRTYITLPNREKADLARVLTHRKGMEVLGEFFINSILSGPWTHVVNITSNTVMALEGVVEGVVKSRSMGEAKSTLFGFMKGVQEGFGMGLRALAKGESYLDHLDKIELSKAISADYLLPASSHPALIKAVNVVGEIVRLPGRFLTAEDEFFKTISYRMKLNQLAYRKAAEEAGDNSVDPMRVSELMQDVDLWVQAKHINSTYSKGAEVQDEILDSIREMDDLYTRGLEDMYEESLGVARDRTFTAQLGERGRSVQNLLTKNPEGRFIMPFVRTPVNILKYFGNRLPLLNLINDDYSKALTKALTPGVHMTLEEVDKVKEFTYRTMLGGSLLLSGFTMAENGTVTGGIPKDNYTMQDAGWKPYSIKIGDTYYQYNRFDPAAMFIGTMADIHSLLEADDNPDTHTDEIMVAAMTSVSNNFLNKTYMSGLSDFMEAVNGDDPAKFDSWAKRLTSAFVPSAVGQLTKGLDPIDRETFDIIDAFKNKLPGQSESLIPKRDYRGREKTRQGIYGPYSGSKMSERDPLDQEIVRLEMNFGKIEKTVEGIALTPEQYDYIAKEAGTLFEQMAKPVIESSEWDTKYTDNRDGMEGTKALVLKQIMSSARTAAKGKALQHFPDLVEQYKDHAQRKGDVYTPSIPGVI